MFDANDLACLDPEYFNIISVNEYDVKVMSRNTGHYWLLHDPEDPERGTVLIFHSHHADKTGRIRYHLHGEESTLQEAVQSIRGHDRFQMNGRKRI